jgi:hypothetical protein
MSCGKGRRRDPDPETRARGVGTSRGGGQLVPSIASLATNNWFCLPGSAVQLANITYAVSLSVTVALAKVFRKARSLLRSLINTAYFEMLPWTFESVQVSQHIVQIWTHATTSRCVQLNMVES